LSAALGTIPRDALLAERVAQLKTLLVLYVREHDWNADPDPEATLDCLYAVRALYGELAQLVPPAVQRQEEPAEDYPAGWLGGHYFPAGATQSSCGEHGRAEGRRVIPIAPGKGCPACREQLPAAGGKEAP
jgi:hypothetical protein